jgi:pimeloyl-ACP methyl ester carboxylesterase
MLHIAYQVVGDGPRDILFVPGWTSHLELGWRFPSWAHLLNRLASFSRLIVFDKRGTGLSDPVTTTPTLEERVRDICAVMDAVGSERAVLFGECEGAPVSVMFAAAHPERTEALAMYGAMPCVSVEAGGPRWIDDAGRTLEDAILNWGHQSRCSRRAWPAASASAARWRSSNGPRRAPAWRARCSSRCVTSMSQRPRAAFRFRRSCSTAATT